MKTKTLPYARPLNGLIRPDGEQQKLQANGVTLTLSGIPSDILNIALSDDYQGKPITIWFAVLDGNREIIADPYQLFSGQMDVMKTYDDGITSSVTLTTESDLVDMRQARERRYTPEDQKIDFPDDKGLDFIPTIQDLEIVWGRG
ncbi:MAG: hypothetical protein COA45_03985 [Zetaproteobacteria bacterium]|nr:MAG: hypothetical protein COA45_03985 [Zetaproteobacteria bacterium]